MERYFHGGKPGLKPGEVLKPEPHFVEGCPICEQNKAGKSHIFEPLPQHADRIYMTTDRAYARFYASKYPQGDLYTVEPIGEANASHEDRFPTIYAEGARVLKVYERFVELTGKQRRALLRRWKIADQAVDAAIRAGSR